MAKHLETAPQFRAAALRHLGDACALVMHRDGCRKWPGHAVGAVYLACYAVECGLKARVLSVLGLAYWHEAEDAAWNGTPRIILGSGHQYAPLIALGRIDMSVDPRVDLAFQSLNPVNAMNVALRYDDGTTFCATDARQLVEAAAVVHGWL